MSAINSAFAGGIGADVVRRHETGATTADRFVKAARTLIDAFRQRSERRRLELAASRFRRSHQIGRETPWIELRSQWGTWS